MFWRSNPDPTNIKALSSTKSVSGKSPWPRTNTEMRGIVHDLGKSVGEAKTNFWLQAQEMRLPGQTEWTTCSAGCWMPLVHWVRRENPPDWVSCM